VLASIEQGDNVRRLAGVLKIPLNPDFGHGLVQSGLAGPGSKAQPVNVGGIEFTVIGPLQAELIALQKDHDKWLKEHPERQADATALLTAISDTAVANLSSIVLLARRNGKTLLLTGDASAEKVVDGLEETGLVAKGQPFSVDILKMPHHGSIRNIDAERIKRLPAKTYAFSGSGKFGNPDRETLDLLFKTRPGVTMTLVLSYKVDFLDTGREADRQAERRKHPNKPAWNVPKDALSVILKPPPAGTSIVESPGRFVAISF
jgi:hypothetical protein